MRTDGSGTSADTVGGLLFVLLWSTGYIAAGSALHGSGPFTLAAVRFLGTALIVGAWLLVRSPARPSRRSLLHSAASGLMLQAGFFGFTYAGLRTGVPVAAAGLICGLMPLVTAFGAALFLGERLRIGAVIGMVLGLAGVLLVIGPGLRGPGNAPGYGFLTLALLSLSFGTLYQKRHGGGLDPRLSLVVQVLAALAALLPFAWLLEGLRLAPTPVQIVAIGWVVLVNSCAGLLLYLWLLHRGGAGRVASLFYLVPPVTAVLAAVVLGVHFTLPDAAGFGLAATGVWLGQRA